MGQQDQLVSGNAFSQRFGSNRRGADGVRVEKLAMSHYIADSRRDPEHDD